MRSVDSTFYWTPRWHQTRKLYLQSVDGLCERCLAKGIYSPAVIVHHKKHLTEENVTDEQIAYGFDNLEALCESCHNEEHFAKKKDIHSMPVAN